MGKTEVYELLCILDFNNVRKRMSVILRHDGKIRLYCKGADSIIYDHLAPGNDINKNKTQVTSLTKKNPTHRSQQSHQTKEKNPAGTILGGGSLIVTGGAAFKESLPTPLFS